QTRAWLLLLGARQGLSLVIRRREGEDNTLPLGRSCGTLARREPMDLTHGAPPRARTRASPPPLPRALRPAPAPGEHATQHEQRQEGRKPPPPRGLAGSWWPHRCGSPP